MLQSFFLTATLEIIRFKTTTYLVIMQNTFEFSSESRVHENEHSTGKSPLCFLIYRDKVRHPSTAKLYMQVWKKVICAIYHLNMAEKVYGDW